MDDIIAIVAQAILQGGPFVSICFLLVFIVYILYDLMTFKKKYEEKDKQINELLEQFVQSNKEMTEAVCDLKVVIAEIKGRLQK